ncbi:hypothetical protein ACHAW5_002521 [Stephanodiscus triporus]|uniref:S1 motif domain-containing protein n=1 Tax=Stephanodiscus triporus TaxID=2934178 RepID=A0ABD3Q918_9STRA
MNDAPTQPKMDGENSGADDVRLRIQRKMARKASGKFKSQAQTIERSLYPADKRKPEGRSTGEDRVAKRPFSVFKGGTSNETSRKPNFRGHVERSPNPSDRRKSKDANRPAKAFKGNSNDRDTLLNKTTPRYKNDNQSAKKNSNPKANKPKHLKRKIHQLSKTIAEGYQRDETDIISVLEGQMKQLAEQMQEFKRLKQKNVQVKQSLGGEVERSGGEDLRAIDNGSKTQQGGKEGGSDSNDGKATFHQETRATTSDTIRTSLSSSNPPDEDLSSDEDINVESSNARTRGKRRRGQRDGAGRRGDDSGENSAINGSKKSAVTLIPNASDDENHRKTPVEAGDTPHAILGNSSEPPIKKTTKKDDKRRCIGRKPVTDFVIGNFYSGKVRYIKPKLGSFIDIGSHSDAFCHISCSSDAFVSSVTDILKVDDIVDARVLEIDREKKRITVSLRSEGVAENEQDRLKTTRQYEHGMKGRDEHSGSSETSLEKEGFGVDKSRTIVNAVTSKDLTPKASPIRSICHPSISNSTNSINDIKRERKTARRAERRAQSEQQRHTFALDDLDEGQVQSKVCSTAPSGQSGIDLKRERKLARRAERRAAKET